VTLKKLLLHPKLDSVDESGIKLVSYGEIKHLISLVKKNYGLERLDWDLNALDKDRRIAYHLEIERSRTPLFD
jgi:hypothetical protein